VRGARAERLATLCRAGAPSLGFEAVRVRSAVGGGSMPLCQPWSWAVAATGRAADALEEKLRNGDPPIVGRIAEGRLILDVRTLGDQDLGTVARAFKEN
jgi:L-seryl-tRNA(Ser) seleniumtransferase